MTQGTQNLILSELNKAAHKHSEEYTKTCLRIEWVRSDFNFISWEGDGYETSSCLFKGSNRRHVGLDFNQAIDAAIAYEHFRMGTFPKTRFPDDQP